MVTVNTFSFLECTRPCDGVWAEVIDCGGYKARKNRGNGRRASDEKDKKWKEDMEICKAGFAGDVVSSGILRRILEWSVEALRGKLWGLQYLVFQLFVDEYMWV